MQIVATFDPSVLTTDAITIPQSAANGTLVVYNESNIALTFTFQNGDSDYVPAWVGQKFRIEGTNVNVTWQHQSILSSIAPPLSQVIVVAYACGEPVPNGFPVALSRQANIGNIIQTFAAAVVPFVTSLVNDGNAAGTQMIESTVAGQSTSSVNVTNDGIWILGNPAFPGLLSSDNATFKTDGLGNLTVKGLTVTNNLTVAGNFTASNGISRFNVGAQHNQIVSYSTFSFVTNGGSQTVAHGLGAIPAGFLWMVQSASPSTVEPAVSAFDATNVTLQSSGGSGIAILGCAI
jgi:hypothetical protein